MATKNELIKFYENNKDFKKYIDECVKTYGKSVDYMLQTRIAESYYEYLKEETEKNENE